MNTYRFVKQSEGRFYFECKAGEETVNAFVSGTIVHFQDDAHDIHAFDCERLTTDTQVLDRLLSIAAEIEKEQKVFCSVFEGKIEEQKTWREWKREFRTSEWEGDPTFQQWSADLVELAE